MTIGGPGIKASNQACGGRSMRITRAGTPTATPPGGTSSSTTAFSPITA